MGPSEAGASPDLLKRAKEPAFPVWRAGGFPVARELQGTVSILQEFISIVFGKI